MAEWKLVPAEITDAMFDAGFDGSDHLESWRNMLAATPPMPAEEVEKLARVIQASGDIAPPDAWDAACNVLRHFGARIEGDQEDSR